MPTERKQHGFPAMVLAIIWIAGATAARADEARSLRGARIVSPAAAPSYVSRAIADLRAQVGAQATKGVPEIRLILARDAATRLGDEGFGLRAGAGSVTVTAADWRGLHYGVLELVRLLAGSADGASVPVGLAVEQRPSFGLRGMYAHTAWVYSRPFALRSWTLEDWKRYVDLLAYLKVNLLQVWNLVSIMPHPLAAADRDYLRIFDEVARYAREERGFRAVWLGDAANNVALPSAVPIREREYYVVHSLRDPGDTAQLAEIGGSRRALYELNAEADGYWVIDSDPGGWEGSPSEDFVRVLAANRRLIDEHARRGRDAELIYWIWHGWGTRSKAEDVTAILGSFGGDRRRYGLLACSPEDLRIAADLGWGAKTVWFPYGAIEGEPSSPYTALRYDAIRRAVEAARGEKELRGIMGNAQTPLVQVPNLWAFQRLAWDSRAVAESDAALTGGAARDVFPGMVGDLVRAWTALGQDNEQEARHMAARLESLARNNRLGEPGVVGRYLPEGGRWLALNLARQLAVHAEAAKLAAALRARAGAAAVETHAEQYLKAALRMVEETGFRPALNKRGGNLLDFFNWFYANGDYALVRAAWEPYRERDPAAAARVYGLLKERYATRSGCRECAEMVEFLAGEPPQRAPGFKYAN